MVAGIARPATGQGNTEIPAWRIISVPRRVVYFLLDLLVSDKSDFIREINICAAVGGECELAFDAITGDAVDEGSVWGMYGVDVAGSSRVGVEARSVGEDDIAWFVPFGKVVFIGAAGVSY